MPGLPTRVKGQILKFSREAAKGTLTPELRGSRITGRGGGISGNMMVYPVSVCMHVVWHVCGLICMVHGV